MNEKMITAPIKIGTWEGEAYLVEGVWHVAPSLVAQHLGFTYENHRRRFNETFPGVTRYLNLPGDDGDTRVRKVAPLGCVLQWMFWLGGSGRIEAAAAARVTEMRAALSDRLGRAILSDSMIVAVDPGHLTHLATRETFEAQAATEGRQNRLFGRIASFLMGGRRDA